jgi:hypothetical protein
MKPGQEMDLDQHLETIPKPQGQKLKLKNHHTKGNSSNGRDCRLISHRSVEKTIV